MRKEDMSRIYTDQEMDQLKKVNGNSLLTRSPNKGHKAEMKYVGPESLLETIKQTLLITPAINRSLDLINDQITEYLAYEFKKELVHDGKTPEINGILFRLFNSITKEDLNNR